jgi:hypothetical protein
MKFATSLAFTLAAMLTAASAFAADKAPADTLTPQQQKMSGCSKDAHAKSLKGDEYKTYMSTCMKGTGTPAAATAAKTATATTTPATTAAPATTATTAAGAKPADASKTKTDPFVGTGAANPQQQKMKTCAADAKTKGLKGADRRTYMSTCLKNDSSATPAPKPAK